jgi:hypothetical protein
VTGKLFLLVNSFHEFVKCLHIASSYLPLATSKRKESSYFGAAPLDNETNRLVSSDRQSMSGGIGAIKDKYADVWR